MTRAKFSNMRVFRVSRDAARFEADVGADQIEMLRRFIDSLAGKPASAELAKWMKKRSLDANAYAWKLLGLMADTLTLSGCATTKDGLYIEMLKRYGQGGVVKIQPGKTDSILREFTYKEPHEKFYDSDDQYYRVWVGSSQYDTSEMSIFIRGIVEDAKELGIETPPPAELERMMHQWRKA